MRSSELLARAMVLDEFAPMVGQKLIVDCSPKAVDLTLTEAYPLRDSGVTERPPFMLIFRSEPEAVLIEGGYAMRCGEFGPALIHISQIMPPHNAPAGNYYQAVFN